MPALRAIATPDHGNQALRCGKDTYFSTSYQHRDTPVQLMQILGYPGRSHKNFGLASVPDVATGNVPQCLIASYFGNAIQEQ